LKFFIKIGGGCRGRTQLCIHSVKRLHSIARWKEKKHFLKRGGKTGGADALRVEN